MGQVAASVGGLRCWCSLQGQDTGRFLKDVMMRRPNRQQATSIFSLTPSTVLLVKFNSARNFLCSGPHMFANTRFVHLFSSSSKSSLSVGSLVAWKAEARWAEGRARGQPGRARAPTVVGRPRGYATHLPCHTVYTYFLILHTSNTFLA
jgi:hypothetical protein